VTSALGQDLSHPDWEMVEAIVSVDETWCFTPGDWKEALMTVDHAHRDDDVTRQPVAWLRMVAHQRYYHGWHR
jgi:hypothetical protein